MGASAQGRCFDSAASAADAVWSGVGPVVSGSPPSISVVELGGTGWQLATYQGGVLQSVEAVPSIAFAPCDPAAGALDGLALGWMVVGVWVVAWGINVLRRGLGWGW